MERQLMGDDNWSEKTDRFLLRLFAVALFGLLSLFCYKAFAQLEGYEAERFCKAWTADAMQAADKMLQGADGEAVEKVIDNIPDHVFSKQRKEMAKSAVRWTYYFSLNREQAEQIGFARCMGCASQHNQQACVSKFDQNLEQYLSEQATGYF